MSDSFIELFQTPAGFEVHHNGAFSTFLMDDELGDYIATYRHLTNAITIYPLERA